MPENKIAWYDVVLQLLFCFCRQQEADVPLSVSKKKALIKRPFLITSLGVLVATQGVA